MAMTSALAVMTAAKRATRATTIPVVRTILLVQEKAGGRKSREVVEDLGEDEVGGKEKGRGLGFILLEFASRPAADCDI
jgi:hypothetical protein